MRKLVRKCVLRVTALLLCVVVAVTVGLAGCGKNEDAGTETKVVSQEDSQKVEKSSEGSETVSGETADKVVSIGTEGSKDSGTISQDKETGPKYMTTMAVTKDMGIGINLGNTFEACGDWIKGTTVTDYETAWGSPVITKAMIEGYAREGFKTLRVPVAWSNLMSNNYTISPALLSRVKEVVGWALEYDMYVILNIHWDGGWWSNFPSDKNNCMAKYKAIWTQLTKEFGEYDHRLIFESLNEEGCWDTVWNRYSGTASGKAEAYGLLNEINQTFVNLVRASGGNNADRHLLIAGYATDVELTCDEAFVMPKDTAGRCAVSVHYYTPANYCVLTENTSWASVKTTWGTTEDKAELQKNMSLLKSSFVDKGIPVIIGEFGVIMDNKDKEDAIGFLTSVAEASVNYGMCPVLWDITCDYSFYNRKNCAMSEYTKLRENFKNLIK